MEHKQKNQDSLKSILFLAGSFTFTFLLAEMVHEFGHYLAHLAFRNLEVGIHLDPFGGSRITGVKSMPDVTMLVTTIAGPLFSLVLGNATTLLLWRFRKPVLLPFLLWGPVAMIQEGVNLSLGLLSPGSDAAWISTLLLPGVVVLVIGLILLAGGVLTIPLFLSLAGIQADEPDRNKLGILLVGMGFLMIIRFVHSIVVSPEHIQENTFPLVFAILLSAIVVTLHNPITKKLCKGILRPPIPISNSVILFVWILGGGIFLFQVYILS